MLVPAQGAKMGEQPHSSHDSAGQPPVVNAEKIMRYSCFVASNSA